MNKNIISLSSGVAGGHFWKSSSLIFCSEQESLQHWKWSGWVLRISRDGKFSRVSRQSVLGLQEPPGTILPHIWAEHVPEFVANLATVEKVYLHCFLELPSSSYGIPLGHSVAASLTEWQALLAFPAISFAPRKGLPPFLALQFFTFLLKCREQN